MNHTIDATNQRIGRIASKVAVILQGKLHRTYHPARSGEDCVIIKNAAKAVVTGRKADQKIYYHHTGYMGHLRQRTFADAFARAPETVIRAVVSQMLPKNRLRPGRLRRLTIEP
mgnify:CR=1 FL=1